MNPLFFALCALTSVYSALACILVIAEIAVRRVTRDPQASSRWLNRYFASRPTALLMQIVSALAVMAWLAIMFPWIDLFTFQVFVDFTHDGGLVSYFGEVSSEDASLWFVVGCLNILTAKAAPTLIELFGLLRHGPVVRIPLGVFHMWAPLPA